MKLSESQLQSLILKEVRGAAISKDSPMSADEITCLLEAGISPRLISERLDEQWQAQAGKIGVALLAEQILTQDGRERLASVLTAIPDFIKETVCDALVKDDWGDEPGPLAGAAQAVGPAVSKVCRFGTTVGWSLFYIVAWVLRSLNDNQAEILSDKYKENEGTASPAEVEDVEAEIISEPPDAPAEEIQLAQWSDEDQPGLAEAIRRLRLMT